MNFPGLSLCNKGERQKIHMIGRMQSSNLFERLIFLLACSVHFVRRQVGRLLRNSAKIAQNRRRTNCTEHASKKIRPSRRLELYFLQIRTEVFRCGLRTFAWTSHVSYWIVEIGTEYRLKRKTPLKRGPPPPEKKRYGLRQWSKTPWSEFCSPKGWG